MLRVKRLLTIIGIVCVPLLASGPAVAEDELIVKGCQELMHMAKNYQEDLKTVDTVLGSAIDAGGIDRIKNYQLKKNAVRKQLESVLRAIDLKGCVKQR
jgi:hypothetical protein